MKKKLIKKFKKKFSSYIRINQTELMFILYSFYSLMIVINCLRGIQTDQNMIITAGVITPK